MRIDARLDRGGGQNTSRLRQASLPLGITRVSTAPVICGIDVKRLSSWNIARTRCGQRRSSLGTLMTICPITGRNIEMGIETDKRTLAGSGKFSARVACPVCKQEHPVLERDTWVCETIGGKPEFYPEA